MITIQITASADDSQRAEHLIRSLFDITASAEPVIIEDICQRVIYVNFIPANQVEWQCPLCGEDMPDTNKIGHLLSSHEASREIRYPWRVNRNDINTTRLEDIVIQLNTFCTRQETRPEGLYSSVRNQVRDAMDTLRQAIKTYREE